jgi:hypothetical protein
LKEKKEFLIFINEISFLQKKKKKISLAFFGSVARKSMVLNTILASCHFYFQAEGIQTSFILA